MKLHIFESFLADRRGHFYEYAKSVRDEWVARGHDATVHCQADAEADIVAQVGGTRLFSRRNYSVPLLKTGNRKLDHLLNYLPCNLLYMRDLRRLDQSRLAADDVALFPTIDYNQLLGILLWHLLLPARHRPLLVLLLRFTNFEFKPERRLTKHALLYRLAFRLFDRYPHNRRVVWTTDSDILAEEYEGLSGQKFAVLPIPHLPDHGEKGGRSAGRAATFVYLGDAREEKGFHLLPEAIEAVVKRNNAVRFVIQSQASDYLTEPVSRAMAVLPSLGSNVAVVEGKLDSERYYQLIEDADAVLVPYDPGAYHGRSSGIFSEAIGCGRPIITTSGTWMERQMRRFHDCGVAFSSWTSAGLADAMEDFIGRREELQALAQRARREWNAFHNAATYVDMLLAMHTNQQTSERTS